MPNHDEFGPSYDEFDRPGLHWEEDRPNSLLQLAWQGRPPTARVRVWGATALFLAAVGWGIAAAYTVTLSGGNAGQFIRGAQLGLVLLVILYFLYVGALLLGRFGGYWLQLTWDAGDSAFTAVRRGWLWWGRKTISIPFAQLTSIALEQGVESRGPLSLKLRVYYRDANGLPGSFIESLGSLGYVRRKQGRKLLFAIGRIVGAEGYLVTANNLRMQELLLRLKQSGLDEGDDESVDDDSIDEDSGDDVRSDEAPPFLRLLRGIPSPGEPDNLDELRPASENQRSAAAVSFDADAANQQLEFTRIEEWRPGHCVRIVSLGAPIWIVIVLEALAIGAAALCGAYPAWGAVSGIVGGDPMARFATIALVSAAGGALAAMLMFNKFRERELTLDWQRGQLTSRVGGAVQEWPLTAIQGLSLAQVGSGNASGDGERSRESAGGADCRLDLVLPERDLLVMQGERTANQPRAARQTVVSLAEALSVALETECSRTRFDPSAALREAFRVSPAQQLVLAACAIAAVGLLGWGAVREQQVRQAAAQLRALGVDIERMGSFARNDDLICENYWNIKWRDGRELAPHRAEIKDLLASLPKLGLDASESHLIDADLDLFRGASLCVVDISQTRVTDAGVSQLADCEELVYLDAYDTPIGDAALKALSPLPRLRFLFLPGTRVTDEGLKSLYGISTLRVVHLGGCPVTPPGIAALERALPAAKVIH